ncbi:sensor domain-containing protein [Actinomadura sp. 6N118]|uniref:sensor histidine kinase n=1 Tax=Actinomadura sp. 6N118 TaxID=3375151 RepID=UPI0037A0A838
MSGELTKENWAAERLRAPWHGFRLGLLAFPALAVSTLLITSYSLVTSVVGILMVPPVVMLARSLMNVYRDLIGKWTGVQIERPYLPEPPEEEDPGFVGQWNRFLRLSSDPATWRDMAWLIADPIVVFFTAALPFYLVAYGLWGLILAGGVGDVIADANGQEWYGFIHIEEGYADNGVKMTATVLLGTVFMVAGFLSGPRLLKVYGRWGQLLLGPTEKSKLALRVQHLTETRSDAVDASAAELRRIERDLHDGAQARLVAMGMTLGAIEHLLDKDPAKARLLLAETRQSSAKALHELRDLVRGIHPPVLADRGIGDAVKALALDHPLQVEVTSTLPGRPQPPVESATYFAVSEILTNAAKHSGASRVWIDLRYDNGFLRITVTDDGQGGATLEGGTGLRGIERRIGTFDGVLALNSPLGGPTIVTLELPCELSSPKTLPS